MGRLVRKPKLPEAEPQGGDFGGMFQSRARPAATGAGLPDGSRPRDLRSSYASVLIASGMSVVEVAQELGHSPSMCLTTYARAFAEYDPKKRVSPELAIQRARR